MKPYVVYLISGVLVCQHAPCQVIEIRETGKNINQVLDLVSPPVIDINSKLEIHLSQDSLLRNVDYEETENEELVSRLEILNDVLINQVEIMALLNVKIGEAKQREDLEILGEYSVLMVDFYERLLEHDQLRTRANELFREYFRNRESLSGEYPTAQEYVIRNMALGTGEILETLRNSDEVKRIIIQLAAFLNTGSEYNRKVHIENYDTYSNGEFYEVERWVTSFSDEDLGEFERTGELADALNEAVDKNFTDLQNLLVDRIGSARCMKALLDTVRILVIDRDDLVSGNREVLSSFLLEVQDELTSVYELVIRLSKDNFREADLNILEAFNKTRQQFIEEGTSFKEKLDSLVSGLPGNLRNENSRIAGFLDSLEQCPDQIMEDVGRVKNVIQITRNMLFPFHETAGAAQEIGEEVFGFTINELPETGYIDLKTTGRRENDDELVIKLIVKTGEEFQDKQPGNIVEAHTLILQQTRLYSVSRVTIIMASPMPPMEKVSLENQFQFAPSGSLLLKFGSRKSPAWNFLNPGFGFNMSTPDFDLDGVPDVGFGGVLTILQDIVSLGISYNTKTDNPFWFFGLSLPFTSPGLPINTIETKNN